MKHVNITVAGKVQGVFFRANAKTKADDLGIKGFVRNEFNGAVYIEAEGNEESLRKFVEWCSHGPRFADVKQCDVSEGEISNYPDFSIQH